MNDRARLLAPALRWDRAHGFRYLEGLIDDAIRLGVGGFLIEGGPRDEVTALIARLHAESRAPILVGARAERGAGETIEGLAEFPPLAALAAVAVIEGEPGETPSLDVELIRRAARMTAREFKSVGVNWALAPVCDLDVARGSHRVGIRAAGSDPAVAAAIVSEWVDACQAEAVVACAMHFPGIGHALEQSGGALPVLKDHAATLHHSDLVPFGAAIDAGAASVMIAHLSAPGIGAPEGATYSAALIENLLRNELHFDGIVTTVAFDRELTIDPAREGESAVRAVAAGCDLVLAPADLGGVADALAAAARSGALTPNRVLEARARIDRWAGWARPGVAREVAMDDVMWSRQIADRSVRFLSGTRPRVGGTIEVVVCRAGDAPDAFGHFADTLRALHIDVTESVAPTPGERAPLVVLFAPGVGPGDDVSRAELDRARATAKLGQGATHHATRDAGQRANRDVVIVAYCHPRAAAALGADLAVVCAWEPTRAMQQASARAMCTTSAR